MSSTAFCSVGMVTLGSVARRNPRSVKICELVSRIRSDRNGIGQIGFSGEDVLDGLLFGRHGDLGLGRQAEPALGEDLRVGIADPIGSKRYRSDRIFR